MVFWLYDNLPEENIDRMKRVILYFFRAFPVSKSIGNNIFLLPIDLPI
jgi:hypothetical protein